MLSVRSRLTLLARARTSSPLQETLRSVGSWATVCADGMGARDGPAKAYNLGEAIEYDDGLSASSLVRSPEQSSLKLATSAYKLSIRRKLTAVGHACQVCGRGIDSAFSF